MMLLVDTFTNFFDPGIGQAALAVLADAGYRVIIPERPTCCAITWISTGQLGAARKILTATVAELSPAVAAGIPVVGLEPSCTAVLRSDAIDLLGTPEARALAGAVKTLSELLAATRGWAPPAPGRDGGRGPAALPPRGGDGLGRRRGPAGAGRRRADPARQLLRPGGQLRDGARALRGVQGRGATRPCCPRSAQRPARPSWPTASPAGPSSPTWPPGRACTWPSSWPAACPAGSPDSPALSGQTRVPADGPH